MVEYQHSNTNNSVEYNLLGVCGDDKKLSTEKFVNTQPPGECWFIGGKWDAQQEFI